LVLPCSPRVVLSHGTCESEIRISSEKIFELKGKYNRKYTVCSEQIGAAEAKSLQTSPYVCHYQVTLV